MRRRFDPRIVHGFVHNEAFANELAGLFYAARGYEKIATTYCGTHATATCVGERMPRFANLTSFTRRSKPEKPISDATATIHTPVGQLELATVIKVSEAVSSEIVPERLIDTIMRTALEHAGAERGLLILARGDEYRIEAEATNQQRSGDSRPSTGKVSPPRIYPIRFFIMSFGPKKWFSCTTHPVRINSQPMSIFEGITHGLCSVCRC